MSIDIRRILTLLPHRYPFLLVDRVIEVDPGQRVRAIKNVTVNEPFFPGHFQGNPVMPGVLIVEAMAQAGALLLLHDTEEDLTAKYMYLAGVDKARFRRTVVPGDRLEMELEMMSLKSRACRMRARATVDGELAAQAELLSMLVDVPEVSSA